ncbi:MAG TPA: cadherin domain-containing protein, partial [Planctomycetaceae bacterium]
SPYPSEEDRAVVEFDLNGLGAVKGGTLDLQLAVNNSLGGGIRTFAVLVYSGNGQADLTDYSVTATQVAQVNLDVSQQSGSYQIDVSGQVQQVLQSGARWVGVRVDPVNDSAPSILVDATLTVNAAPTIDPVPQARTIYEDAGPQTLDLTGISAGGREDQPLRVTAVSSNTTLIPNPTVAYTSPDRTGQIQFAPNHDANGSTTITITVTDAGIDQIFGTADDATTTQRMFVSVLAVNDPPVISDQSFSLNENSAFGTSLGTVLATDPENQGMTYAITSGNSSNAFAINANTGAMTVANPAALDFETTPQFQLTVQVTDKGSPALSASAAVTINLIDVNEPPIIAQQSFALPENSPAGTAVGTVTAVDPENQGVTWSIVSGNTGNAFAIDANTGAITVATSAALDFETTPLFQLTVQATDKGTPQQSAAGIVAISLTDVNEPPVVAQESFTLAENSPAGTAVGTVTAVDPENQGVTWSIVSGNTGNAFAINVNTGAITVANSAPVDFETNPVFQLTVKATDKGTPQASSTAVVTINLFNAPLAVALDIVPGDSTNKINLRTMNQVEVAILSTATFDAHQVDVNSLTFGVTGFENSLVRNKRGVPTYRYADVNGDGRLDLVATFDVSAAGFKIGSTVGILRGLALDGDDIYGTQSVQIVDTGKKK